jgi:general secretion pathway protein K
MRACTIREMRTKRAGKRGMALIMVLLAITILTVFLTDVQQDTSSTFSSAIAARERLKAEYHARSAINLSRLLIATEPTVSQSLGPMLQLLTKAKEPPQIPVWEFADQILGVFNDAEGAEGFASIANVDMSSGENLGLGGNGRFEMVIVDEASKINVNIAARGDSISAQNLATQLMGLMHGEQYNPLFERLDADGQAADRLTVCSALVDWADYNQEREACDLSNQKTTAGAEDNVYQTMGSDYVRKNAAYDSLAELRMVQGVSEDFWATFVDPDPRKPGSRNLTVWGSGGAINPNTANGQVLWALICTPNIGAFDQPICMDPIKAVTFISTLSLIKGFLSGVPLFGSGKDFTKTIEGKGLVGPILYQMLQIDPDSPTDAIKLKNPAEIRRMLTMRSKVFSVYATGVVPSKNRETRVSIHAVMDFRNAADITTAAPATPNTQTPAPGQPPPPQQPPQDPAKVAMAQMAANPAGNVIYWRVQ